MMAARTRDTLCCPSGTVGPSGGRHRRPVGDPGPRTVRSRGGDRPGEPRVGPHRGGVARVAPVAPPTAARCRAAPAGCSPRRYVARRGQTQTRARRGGGPGDRRRGRTREDVMSVLADAVRDVQTALERRRVTSTTRTTFQAATLLLRDERARVRADETTSESKRTEKLKRLDDIASSLARTAVRDQGLMALLGEDARVSPEARALAREMLARAGVEQAPVEAPPVEEAPAAPVKAGVAPQAVVSRQMPNPFLAPDFSAARPSAARPSRLAGWELLGPLLRSFERAGSGASACMDLPEPSSRRAAGDHELMPHPARLVAPAPAGHRPLPTAHAPG